MCYIIEPEYILFQELRNKDKCSMSELFELKLKIENKIPEVFIDVSKGAILSSINYFSDIFSWKNNSIVKKSQSNFDNYIHIIDNKIDEKIRSQVQPLLDNG